MSWLRSALNRAAEVGTKTGLGRNLQKVAGSVYQQAGIAMDRGARFMQNNLAGKPYSNYKSAVRRLEDVALHARGEERLQAVSRWLGALRDLQRVAETGGGLRDLHREPSGNGEAPDSPKTPRSETEEGVHRSNLVLFYDPEVSDTPMTFRDVFLRSLALENLVTSFIEEGPQVEEVQAVLEIFRLCLSGGPELHNAIMSGIQDLSKAAASYTEEVLVTRAELLKMARECVAGLKLSAESEKLDAEVASLRAKIEALNAGGEAAGLEDSMGHSDHKRSSKSTELYRLTAKLQDCLEKKVALDAAGPTGELHDKKVEGMRSQTMALQAAIAAMKKKIEENKQQKADAVTYRGTKAKEVAEAEKVLSQEVMVLEQKREKLEAELAEVKSALAAATHRHINMQEEKEQFDEASSHMVAQLAQAEQELNQSVEAHKTEAGVVATWQSFLEDTWVLQTGCHESKGKEVVEELKEARAQHVVAAATYLKEKENELSALIKKLETCSAELEASDEKKKQMSKRGMDGISADIESGRRKLEDRYLDTEARVKKMLAGLEKVKETVGAHVKRAEEAKQQLDALKRIAGSFDAIATLREKFEGFKRPHIDLSLRQPAPVNGTGKSVPGRTKSGEADAKNPETKGSTKGSAKGSAKTGPAGKAESDEAPSSTAASGFKMAASKVEGEEKPSKSDAQESATPSTSDNVDKKDSAKVETKKDTPKTDADDVDELFGDLDAVTGTAGANVTDDDIEGWDLDD